MHCVAVKATLEKLKKDYPDLEIEDVDMMTDQGQKMVQEFGIMASPGILIDGKFFATGGATEAQFREKFETIK